MKIKVYFLMLLSLFLTACGGGGGGGSATSNGVNPSSNNTATYQTQAYSLSESSVKAIKIPVAASSINVENPDSNIKVTYSGGVLNVNAGNVDKIVTLTVDFKNSSNAVVYKALVTVNNTSADAMIKEAKALYTQSHDIIYLTDDSKLYFYFVDTAYLKGLITYGDRETLLSDFVPLAQPEANQMKTLASTLSTDLTNYDKGAATDTEVKGVMDSFISLMTAHSSYGVGELKKVQFLGNGDIPDVTLGTMAYDYQNNVFSRFIGDSNYGSYASGKWAFSSTYSFLNNIVNIDLANQICKI